MNKRLNEETVINILKHGCQIIIGKLSVTPVKRARTLRYEYLIDCDHSNAKTLAGTTIFKKVEDAAYRFCMLKNVIYANRYIEQ